MKVKELIDRLQQRKDEKFERNAVVRILDSDGSVVVDDIELFDVKDGMNSIDICLPFKSKLGCFCDDDDDYDDDDCEDEEW